VLAVKAKPFRMARTLAALTAARWGGNFRFSGPLGKKIGRSPSSRVADRAGRKLPAGSAELIRREQFQARAALGTVRMAQFHGTAFPGSYLHPREGIVDGRWSKLTSHRMATRVQIPTNDEN